MAYYCKKRKLSYVIAHDEVGAIWMHEGCCEIRG